MRCEACGCDGKACQTEIERLQDQLSAKDAEIERLKTEIERLKELKEAMSNDVAWLCETQVRDKRLITELAAAFAAKASK